jgi:hypothetical protein
MLYWGNKNNAVPSNSEEDLFHDLSQRQSDRERKEFSVGTIQMMGRGIGAESNWDCNVSCSIVPDVFSIQQDQTRPIISKTSAISKNQKYFKSVSSLTKCEFEVSWLTKHQINLHQNISQEKILIFDHQPVLDQTCPIISKTSAISKNQKYFKSVSSLTKCEFEVSWLTKHQINLHQNISQEKILIFDHQPVLDQTRPIISKTCAISKNQKYFKSVSSLTKCEFEVS